MKVYLAGPMRGRRRGNFDAFDNAAAQLRIRGYTVVSPAEHDVDMGFDPRQPGGTLAPTGSALAWDLCQICSEVDAVAVLPGWEHSLGALAEVATARAVGVRVFALSELLDVRASLLEVA